MDAERWGVAANVLPPGTKRFVAGAKVFLPGGLWGDGGERVYVWGRHRGGPVYIKIIMPLKRLGNFRPVLWRGHKIERADLDWNTVATKEEAAAQALEWQRRQELLAQGTAR